MAINLLVPKHVREKIYWLRKQPLTTRNNSVDRRFMLVRRGNPFISFITCNTLSIFRRTGTNISSKLHEIKVNETCQQIHATQITFQVRCRFWNVTRIMMWWFLVSLMETAATGLGLYRVASRGRVVMPLFLNATRHTHISIRSHVIKPNFTA